VRAATELPRMIRKKMMVFKVTRFRAGLEADCNPWIR
jgi:hypothetical protein